MANTIMPEEKIFIVSTDSATTSVLENVVLRPAGYQVTTLRDCAVALELINANLPDLVFLGRNSKMGKGLNLPPSY